MTDNYNPKDKKNLRRTKSQNKSSQKNHHPEDDLNFDQTNKEFKRQKKIIQEEDEWEEWNDLYNK